MRRPGIRAGVLLGVVYVASGELGALAGLMPSLSPTLYLHAFALSAGAALGALAAVLAIALRGLIPYDVDVDDVAQDDIVVSDSDAAKAAEPTDESPSQALQPRPPRIVFAKSAARDATDLSAAAREPVTEAVREIAATGIENRRVARVADVPGLHRLAVGPLRVLFMPSPADSSEPTALIVLRIVDRAQLGPAIDSARRTRVTRRPASGSD